jgi:hypothetical protein
MVLWVHGNDDTVGAASSADKVASGLSLDARVRQRAYALGSPLAATLIE